MRKYKKETYKKSQYISISLASIVNDLAKIMLKIPKSFIFSQIELEDSFPLINEIIDKFKNMCTTNRDNKKLLLLELFQSYFLNRNSFKKFRTEEIDSYSNIIRNYSKNSSLTLQSNRAKLIYKEKNAKQFINLLLKIKNIEEFFLNIGLLLLEQNNYKIENLIKYVICILSYKKDFYYDLNNIIQMLKAFNYEAIINKFDSFMDKYNSTKDKNIQLIYEEDHFKFIEVDIDILYNIINFEKSYSFPKNLIEKINEYINNKNEKRKNKEMKNEIDRKERKEMEEKRKKDKSEVKERIEKLKKEIEEENKKLEKNILFNPKLFSSKKTKISIKGGEDINKLSNEHIKLENSFIKEILKDKTSDLIDTKLLMKEIETNYKLTNIRFKEVISLLEKNNSEIIDIKERFNVFQSLNEKHLENYKVQTQEMKNKLQEIKNKVKNLNFIVNKKIENIKTIKNEVNKLKQDNKEVNSILGTIMNRDIYKAIVDYMNNILNIKSNENYEQRIIKLIEYINQYMKTNKSSSVSLCKLISFLHELSSKINDGNDKAHIIEIRRIEDDHIIKMFPSYEELLKKLFKLNLTNAIKYFLMKKKAVFNEDYQDTSKFEELIKSLTAQNGPNFFKFLS